MGKKWLKDTGTRMSFAFCPKVKAETSLSSGDNTVGGASLTSQMSCK